jgi:hypothetical protein
MQQIKPGAIGKLRKANINNIEPKKYCEGLEHFSPFLFYAIMNFRINLRPSPAAPYFTVQEHLRRKEKYDLKKGTDSVKRKLKKILGVSARYGNIILLQEQQGLEDHGYQIVAKDDPLTGIDYLKKGVEDQGVGVMLDLSYSFPQVASDIPSGIEALLVHTSKSLGIPGEFKFLFTGSGSVGSEMAEYPIDEESGGSLSIIDAVLDDYFEKGTGGLLRESNYKAAVLYQMIESCPHLEAVAGKDIQSKTMITAAVEPSFLSLIEKMGYEVGSHAKGETLFMTMANYPTHSKESIEMLADRVAAL